MSGETFDDTDIEVDQVDAAVYSAHSTEPTKGEVTREMLLRGQCLIPAVTALVGPAYGDPWVSLSEDARELIKARLTIARQSENNGQVRIAGQPYGAGFLSRVVDAVEGRLDTGRQISSEMSA